jgi:tight adherence protein B
MNFLLVFILFWAMAFGGWMIVRRSFQSADADKIRQRLLGTQRQSRSKKSGNNQAALLSQDDIHRGKFVLRLLSKFDLQPKLKALIEQAGLKWNVARLVHMCLALFLGGYSLGWLLLPARFQLLAFIPAIIAGLLPLLYVARVKSKRMFKFESQFPESLEFIARSMRAGHAFSVSLEMLHREFQEPLSGEFRRAFEEHNLGLPLDTALQKLANRVPLLDVHFFVSAVLLQKRTGGNLAEILDKLASVIRERFKLRGKIRAISAHGKITGSALSMIPVGVGAMMFLVNREYVTFFLTDEVGNYMAAGALALQVLGFLAIKKIVAIEV